MADEDPIDRLVRYGQRIRKAFEPEPKPDAVSEERRKSAEKAMERAIGPRFIDTTSRDVPKPAPEPVVKVAAKKPVRGKVKKGPSKY
jgi:hypothetical protein